MLTLFDRSTFGSRRRFLTVGSLALGAVGLHGLTLPRWMAAASSEPAQPDWIRDRAVVLLFLHGGPSQIETFDPKMDAPAGIRSVTGEQPTPLSGITFGGTFPRLAGLADRLSIVRSFQSGDGNHDIKPVVGRATGGANIGSLVARMAGTNHPRTGMPHNAALFPRSVDPSTQVENTSFGDFRATGDLGSAFAPFVPGGEGEIQTAMNLHFSQQRLEDRRNLLTQLDLFKRNLDAEGNVESAGRVQQQAFDTILGGVAGAFDLSREDPATLQRYDTAPLVHPDEISRNWLNYNNYVDNAKSLGKLLLLARRLCEHGCRFITVTTNFVWDMHADVNNATMDEGMQYMGLPLDYAVSAFIEDVAARGLTEKILLVVTGEMGRTPRVNNNGGRDHWGGLTPLLLSGGGLPMGQVVGHSTPDAGQPSSEPQRIENLVATIMHSQFDVGQIRTMTGIPEPALKAITGAEPIPGLIG